jgi:CheY-like chemotaxis protein
MGDGAVQATPWFYVLDEPLKLLVADDDPILREFASVYLASPTASVATVADGAAAWESLLNGQFDVALLDIVMPGVDGFSLLERIRAEPSLCQLPVMMLTGHEDIASVDRAYALGANSFVTKPVNWRLLSYQVRYVLRTSRIDRELRQARIQAQTNEAAYNRTLLAFEVECRQVLKSILQQVGSIRSEAVRVEVERIEALATAALRRWEQFADRPARSEDAPQSPREQPDRAREI